LAGWSAQANEAEGFPGIFYSTSQKLCPKAEMQKWKVRWKSSFFPKGLHGSGLRNLIGINPFSPPNFLFSPEYKTREHE
jgi:hypothetical protein